jgi:hypothetical protein
MDSERNHSSANGGHAAERQPLLPPPLPVNGHPDVDTAVYITVRDSDSNTLLEFRTKLGASALNFFLSGIAMAAVGVSIACHPCTIEAR